MSILEQDQIRWANMQIVYKRYFVINNRDSMKYTLACDTQRYTQAYSKNNKNDIYIPVFNV